MVKKPRIIDITLGIVAVILAILFVVSASIIIPITIHSFYYLNVLILDIPKSSGYDMNTIIEAFNDVLKSVWWSTPFKAGSLAFSSEGASHFKDCTPLFWLDAIIFVISSLLLIAYIILLKKKVLMPVRLKGLSIIAFSGFSIITFFFVFGIWGAIDFDSLFTVFHKVMFPGKTNWQFDPDVDEVINILPIEFFISCAIFILSQATIMSLGLIIYSFIRKHKDKKLATKNGQ